MTGTSRRGTRKVRMTAVRPRMQALEMPHGEDGQHGADPKQGQRTSLSDITSKPPPMSASPMNPKPMTTYSPAAASSSDVPFVALSCQWSEATGLRTVVAYREPCG